MDTAAATLEELLAKVEQGDVVTICRDGEPVAELRPARSPLEVHPVLSKATTTDPDLLLRPMEDPDCDAKAWGMDDDDEKEQP